MKISTTVLAVDIGSISVSIVEMDDHQSILHTGYCLHQGDTSTSLKKLLSDIDLLRVGHVTVTDSTPDSIRHTLSVDNRIAVITAARHLNKQVGSLLIVGGERFGLVLFDDKGNYVNYRSNSSCAAGTGSFLDQQSKRLNLRGIAEFCCIAGANTGAVPKIASRCSVFAKTDLIHAQQEGYTLGEICGGLCQGLAKNVVDTVFSNTRFNAPVLMAGGVALNQPVVEYLSRLIGYPVYVDGYSHIYGAIGAALIGVAQKKHHKPMCLATAEELIAVTTRTREYHYQPLNLSLTNYPDFKRIHRYEHCSTVIPESTPVETDIYTDLESKSRATGFCDAYLGIDIGSTSTKAMLMDPNQNVLAGFYTRTSGRPLEAVQTIFETIDELQNHKNICFNIKGAGTTGSGRKFIGSIIGADLVLDEISAHARAAYALDPRVDTIIEIGGQDAKFTTMKNGSVTFSIMNSVCAAGTGSFIEEQARKLDCPLSEYSFRAEGISAPLASDRCTVFMERDLNYYLNDGYGVDEILASVLHSVRENYLTKVAIEKNIGKFIFFQGATAKNKALVAAFEQRLGKPIMVSKFCHLTGAMGIALELIDTHDSKTSFNCISLYKQPIPISHEVCELCNNHCKIRVAEVSGEKTAYGFLCGRDYNTNSFVTANRSGVDLLKERKKAFTIEKKIHADPQSQITIGIPAGLHMIDELPLWVNFFNRLGVKIVTSERYEDAIKDGKQMAGAEFCAPISAMYGHVGYCADRCDYIFLPVYLEWKQEEFKEKTVRRQYCYYTQFSPAIVTQALPGESANKVISPVLRSIQGPFYMKIQLYKHLRRIPNLNVSFMQVSSAYDSALVLLNQGREQLKLRFNELTTKNKDINVVILGRPYTILSRHMNSSIPDIFATLGVRTFFQDMVPYDLKDVEKITSMRKAIHWHYAVKTLETAEVIGQRKGLYPVLVTSFKCAPDSFVIEYMKQILDAHGKPYLILQLDEHDSTVGYETRIEAGVRAFRNHFQAKVKTADQVTNHQEGLLSTFPRVSRGVAALRSKTLLMPATDKFTSRLVVANLKSEGIDARLVEETTGSIKRSMRYNTGQCIPLNVCVQNVVEYVDKYQLNPADTAMWIFHGTVACNIRLYPYFMKSLLESIGRGMEKIEVYEGEITFADISFQTIIDTYFAYMFGGMLRRVACTLRPYEKERGKTDQQVEKALLIFEDCFLKRGDKETVLQQALALFDRVAVHKTNRPKVALFGDMYVRDNDVMNQNLIKTIEENGGEVITTPYNEYLKIVAEAYIKKWIKEGKYSDAALATISRTVVGIMERKYMKYFKRFIPEPAHRLTGSPAAFLEQLSVNPNHTGESLDNILKIYSIINTYPDIALFVQTNPAFCCPSLITEAMADKIEALTGVPVLTIEYDGTGGLRNSDVIPYLTFPRQAVGDQINGSSRLGKS